MAAKKGKKADKPTKAGPRQGNGPRLRKGGPYWWHVQNSSAPIDHATIEQIKEKGVDY